MKVIFTLDTLTASGTEKSTLDIISQFSKSIRVVIVYFYPGDELKSAYENAGAKVYSIGLSSNTSWRKGIAPFKKIIQEEKPDVVISSILRANIISRIACYQTNTPLIGTFVSDSYSAIRTASFTFKRKLGFFFYYLLDRFTARVPVRWISNSQYIKASNCRKLGIHPDLVDVVYRGRDITKYPIKQNKTNPDVFRFAFVARLLETKGLHELLDAFGRLSKEYSNIQLDIYGDGNFKNKLQHFIQAGNLTNKVVLHGNVPDGWKKLYEADCFVFPSWYEGFSGSLVEAMMVGIPIIASDIPMNKEAVIHQQTALLFHVKDAGSLFDQMKKMIHEYPTGCLMAEQARKEASIRFDIKVIAQQYEDILKSVVESRQNA